MISSTSRLRLGRKPRVLLFAGALLVFTGAPALAGPCPISGVNTAESTDASQAQDTSGAPAPRVEIPWRTGNRQHEVMTPSTLRARLQELHNRTEARHLVVSLAAPVTRPERARLAAAGLELQEYVGSNAFVARLDGQANPSTLAESGLLQFAGDLRAEHRLHPAYVQGADRSWARTETGALLGLEVVNVVFARDVSLARIQALLGQQQASVLGQVDSLNTFLVDLPSASIFALAELDEVLWLEPPLPRLRAGNWEAAQRANVDQVRVDGPPNVLGNPYQLDGSGVSVMVYDVGQADTTHPALFPRATNNDNSGTDPSDPTHPTHVSATIGGSGMGTQPFGTTLPFQHAGMAPGCTIENYGFLVNGTFNNGDLYTNPQDLLADFTDAINQRAAVLSNCSMSSAPAFLSPPMCSWLGDYGVTAALIDQIVIGQAGRITTPFRSVWITGNDRGPGICGSQYGTIAPPGTAKNCITVGAIDDIGTFSAPYSGWGPIDDGRIKPDVVAVGDFVTSAASSFATPGTGYGVASGTSQAAPVVTGSLALLLEDFRVQYPGWGTPTQGGDPYNCTLKAWLIHTAFDLGSFGPDYTYGWGSIDVRAAIDHMRAGQWTEDRFLLGTGERRGYQVTVAPGTSSLRLTLAWDDADAAPMASQHLVDDLDLVVIAPDGTRILPWSLTPSFPANAAQQNTFVDRRNNVEQVLIGGPQPGTWVVQAVLSNGPSNQPRSFGLSSSAAISLDCNNNGILDSIEVLAGIALDCNTNGIPDECDLAAGSALDCNGNGIPDSCDLASGASSDCNSNGIPDSCDLASGASQDCNGNGSPDECDLTLGISQDCNSNTIPDECDIGSGISLDCDGNGVPDECDLDCNNNGIPDACDLITGQSLDCNGNNVPDECDLSSGNSQDCNSNQVPDECDIAGGTSSDCDGNGIPDSCDIASGSHPDCNSNGVPDECDISQGSSTDLNGNGIPDECIEDGDCNGNSVPDILDIQNGSSTDCNQDWVPDDCQSFADCNSNGIADVCDILFGTSLDDDSNTVPDECQSVLVTPSGSFPTIQSAIDAAQDGDTIEIQPGTHSGPGNFNLDTQGKILQIIGIGGPSQCIIDCNGQGRGFYIISFDPVPFVLEGVTVQNGVFSSGGALYIAWFSGASSQWPLIKNCEFKDCTASGTGVNSAGGGVYVNAIGARFKACRFEGNQTTGTQSSGGGLFSLRGGIEIDNCAFVDNSAADGAGLQVLRAGSTIKRCVFDGNQCTDLSNGEGGGISIESMDVDAVFTIKDCSFDDNSASIGGGIYVGGSVFVPSSTVIDRCTLRDNSAAFGGGIRTFNATRIQYCRIKRNHSTVWGGGVYVSAPGSTIRDTLIAQNTSDLDSAGLHAPTFEGGFSIVGSTIANNTSLNSAGGLRIWVGSIENSIVYGNRASTALNEQIEAMVPGLSISYCDVEDGLAGIEDVAHVNWGAGNLDIPPRFKSVAGGNFHLSFNSPCINKGDPAFVPEPGETDFDRHARVIGNRVDQGADEVGPQAQIYP